VVAHKITEVRAALEAPLGPAVAFGLFGEETPAVPALPFTQESRLEFAAGLFFIQKLQIDQVRDLFDISDRVGDASGPEGVRDPVQLPAQVLFIAAP